MFSFKRNNPKPEDDQLERQTEIRQRRNYQTGSINISDGNMRSQIHFLGITEKDLGVIATWKNTCQKVCDDLVDKFYAHIKNNSETLNILNKFTTVERQRPMLTRYILTMFNGIIDDQYIEYRKRVGKVHDDIDLGASWYVAMYEIIRQELINALKKDHANDQEIQDFSDALSRLIQMDVALVVGALMDSRQGKVEAILTEQATTMNNLMAEISLLVQYAKAGQLSKRADASKFNGEVQKLIVELNNMLDVLLEPSKETIKILQQVARGDLGCRMAGNYQGDNALIKNALNATLNSLNSTFSQVAGVSSSVTRGANQISDSSQALSQGATEQASSLEEISASMDEITTQTRQNADNAAQANKLVACARDFADSGNHQMQGMLNAMDEINKSSTKISKIIKAIDEIAFQTNLLALNAAVEAARAGVHGKGFAVVAEEVRNLAQRSAKAARETTELIEDSIKRVQNGTNIANDTATALSEIVSQITKVTDLVGEIDVASKEQAQGISQINEGLTQIDKVTQANTASAEETASAAEELSGQANRLIEMLNKFKLNHQSANQRSSNLSPNLLSPMHSHVQGSGYKQPVAPKTAAPETAWGETAQQSAYSRTQPAKSKTGDVDPASIISLDDDDFGKF